MEWLGLIIWLLVVACALPLAATGSLVSATLGLQSMLALGGLAATVLFIVLDGGDWLAWLSVGLALAAAAAVASGAARLISDRRSASGAGLAAEENAAALAGVVLPLLLTVAFVMLLAATGITTID